MLKTSWLLLCGGLLGGAAPAHAAAAWPQLALPPGATAFDIGEQVEMNGVPMRMQGVLSALPPAQLAAWYRDRLGQPLAEDRRADKLILGQARGGDYLTVQLEPAGSGSRVLIGVRRGAALQAGAVAREDAQRRLLARLPAGSTLLNNLESVDAGRAAHYLLVSNRAGTAQNVARLTAWLAEDGLALRSDSAAAHGRALWFAGAGKEASAVVQPGTDGSTSVAINIVTLAAAGRRGSAP